MNDYLRHLKKLSLIPKVTLDEQVHYWEVLEYELNELKKKAKHPWTRVKIKAMKHMYPVVFKDLQTLHKVNKEISELLR